MADWRTCRVGDLVAGGALLISDGYRVRNEELGPSGIPFVRGGDIGNSGDGWINTETEDHIRTELAERVTAKLTRPGDVAFITKGTVGRAGRLRADQAPVVFAPQVAYWRVLDSEVLDATFLYYLITSSHFQSALYAVKSRGSMVADYVSITEQIEFRLLLPPVHEQRVIARILGAFDDKIELNRRMSSTLEEMARALFRSWFVDFDPVRAKAEGRDPGLPEDIAALFPDRFEESELGEIPAGWEVSKLGDLLELAYGRALKAEDREPGDVPVYGSNGQVGWHKEWLMRAPGIVLGRKGNPGVATWAPSDFFVIDTAFYVVPSAKCPALHFLFHALTTLDLGSFGGDSAVPGLNRNTAYGVSQILPGPSVLVQFESVNAALSKRLAQLEAESRTLAALRDSLLPKLISGELRVPEELLERASDAPAG
jgi:type I restriction enzyme, S subunit